MSGCPFEAARYAQSAQSAQSAKYGCGCSAVSAHYGGSGSTRRRSSAVSVVGVRSTRKAALARLDQSVGVYKRRPQPRRNPTPAKRQYFLRPESMSPGTKKYCRCLAEVGTKTCAGGSCYTDPYAVCGRVRPAGMKGGCSMLYDYDNMPYAATAGAATMRNKSIRDLVEAAKQEVEHLKHA